MDHNPIKIPSPLLSLVPILVLVALLFVTIRIFGSDALSGGSQVVLLTATAVCCLIAMGYSKVRWKAIELAMINNISGVATALIILLIIGALSGSWMISGVVPTLIYYGMQIIHPSFFLTSTCVICAIVSVMTGSSWTTIATIGIALLGIGQAQGFDDGWIAGAIVSGAYFGDKISPLSDTTILASSVTDTPLFKHIKYMMITTVPSIVITLVIFTVAGLTHEATASDQIAMYSASLKETFDISLWLLIVPIITGILIAKRIPSIITLFISTALAGIFALIFQPHLLQEISGLPIENMQSQFKGLIMTFYGSTQIQTGNPDLNELVSTRGMSGMMNTIWLIICAMCFGGAMTASGMLGSITSVFIRFMKRTVGLVASTVASGLFLNICTADQYISIILTGNMFKDIYQKKGYESRLLSRTTEDAVTVTSPLIPWNTCGMTQATILGVATLTYLPYCFFNLISPLMSITVAAIGYKIKRINEKAESIATD
ncbi:Na+/H+ antiporter NhaC [Parabacteroides faecis]|uniref:NhaC family Na+:H+ antiporter n=1 Tax=Parabacteroides faecis TaxID=1217282 RepID=A0ABR6KF91_9BACT|nr:Na+/H+ antiporter NhaC [Parabacteroides faecis]MBB4620160.1 NhaC family Na+:H+ antiporter [Parabacteroides faecis]GGJ95379.1 sodium:proton antiporter [Parabacteroides faecis]